MKMFENYDNPKNEKENIVEHTLCSNPPFPIYNARGNLKGYYWNYGDSIEFYFSPYKKIKVEEDSLIFDEIHEFPSSSNIGMIGQKAYNVESSKSWTCVGQDEYGESVWKEDKCFTYPDDGTKEISVRLGIDNAKNMTIDVFNYKWEPFHTFEFDGQDTYDTLTCTIDSELSLKFVSGIYYFIFKTNNSSGYEVVNKVLFLVK